MFAVGHRVIIGGKAPTSKTAAFPINPYSKRITKRSSERSARIKTTALLGIGTKQDTLSLPIDFYALLQVSRGVSRESVSRSYEKCLANPPNVGYSQQALNAREVVLRGALETLASPATRRQYDERLALGAYTEDVPADFIAGALLLLQEAGDHQTVIASGESWLATHRRHRSAKDVALATALAHCDVAQLRLDAQGSTQHAAAMFELALKLLRDYRTGTPELVKKIESALKDLQPRLALELLSDIDNPSSRARGKAILPTALASLLERVQDSRRDETARRQYLDALRDVLTATEQTELYAVAGNAFAQSPAELYNCAIAHIAAGCSTNDASYIQTAADLLEKAETLALEAQAASAVEETKAIVRDRRSMEESQRRAVAACVTALLLGDSAAAGAALGLNDGRLKCDRQVLAFIKANSPDGHTLLPGVCALVTRWVSDVALTSFKTSTAAVDGGSDVKSEFSLDAWFENPAVVKYLEANVTNNSGKGKNVFKDAVKSIVLGFAGLFTAPATNNASAVVEQEEVIVEAEESVVAAAVAEPPVAATATITREEKPIIKKTETTIENTSTTTTTTTTTTKAAVPAPPAPIKTTPKQPRATDNIDTPLPSFNNNTTINQPSLHTNDNDIIDEEEEDFLTQPVALDAIKPLHGEDDWMRKAYEARQIRWGRLVAAVAVLVGGTVFAAVRAGVPSLLTSTSSQTATATAATTAQLSSSITMSKGEASSLITKWQRIKAAALGQKHNVDALPSVLQGDVLQQWKDRAALVASRGWYYTHDLQSSKIIDVSPSTTLHNAVAVTANFREGVTVHKNDGSEPQTFVSDYQVVYQVVKAGKEFVIASAQVQATS